MIKCNGWFLSIRGSTIKSSLKDLFLVDKNEHIPDSL